MNRRDAILSLLDGGLNGDPPQSYVPAAFFTHFDPSCHRGQAAVDKHAEFFRFTGMDFVKIQYELPFPVQPVAKPADWANVKRLGVDYFEPQLQVVKGLVEALKSEALVLVTLYSPFMCAGQIAGKETVKEHLTADIDAVKKGMEIVTESLLVFVRECVRLGVDGFYHSTQGGETDQFKDPAIFPNGIKPFDLEVMNEIDRTCAFNILHICDYHRDEVGGYGSVVPFLDYPGHVVNCAPEIGGRVMRSSELSAAFNRPFMGGMERKGALAKGTEAEVRGAARKALAKRSGRFILGADCTVPPGTPWENVRAAVDEAHSAGNLSSVE